MPFSRFSTLRWPIYKPRSQARLGMGKVMEAMGLPLVAKEHYAKLIYITKGEEFDAKCVKEAGEFRFRENLRERRPVGAGLERLRTASNRAFHAASR